LNDIADAAAKTNGIPIGGGAFADDDLASGGNKEAIDQSKKSGFAAAAATEEDESLARSDGETNIANDSVVDATVNTVCHILELNGRVSVS